MKIDETKIFDCIYRAVDEINNPLPDEDKVKKSPEAVLFGKNTTLDSLQLITLIVEIEKIIEDELDISITLAHEEALAQKDSPFRTISTLVEYISRIVNET